MSYLERLKQLETHQRPTDRTDKSISVGFVSSLPARIERAANETDPALSDSENGLLRDSPNLPAAAPAIAPAERARLGDTMAPETELIALVDAIADFHGFNPEQRAEAKQIAVADLDAALECFRGLATKIPGVPGATAPFGAIRAVQSATDDRIMCNQCANLAGRKCTRWKELGAARGWEPVQLPLRCEQFRPVAGEADQRTGAERWPNLKRVDE